MKDLLTKNRIVSYKSIDNLHHYSAISIRSWFKKSLIIENLLSYVQLVHLVFAKEIYDLGASINLILLVIYQQLGLGDPKPISV